MGYKPQQSKDYGAKLHINTCSEFDRGCRTPQGPSPKTNRKVPTALEFEWMCFVHIENELN